MKERYHRTSNLIREAKKVALIGTWSDGFEVLEEFLKKFGALYDKTAFTFINIRNNENIDNMIVRDRIISKNLKLIDYEFHDTTSESGIEAESSIQGWHTIMNSLWLIKQPFIEKIRSTPPPEHLYVYGAGIYGLATIRLLLKYEIPVSAVLVTEPAGNPENILGIPVIDAHKLANDSSHCMAIIAVSDKCSNEKIKKKLEEKNMSIIIGFEETPFVYGN